MFEIKPSLTISNIRKRISDFQIIQSIIPNASLNSNFKIRNESNSSASLMNNGNKIYIKDFGDPQQPKAETWYQYLCRTNGWGDDTRGYFTALNWANQTFNLGLEEINTSNIVNNFDNKYVKPVGYDILIGSQSKLKTKIEVKRSRTNGVINWKPADINYWKSFGLSIEKVESKHIDPLDYFWSTNPNKDNIKKMFDVRNILCYVYPYYRAEDDTFMYKIYMPFGLNNNKHFKWVSNTDSSVIENLRFITKPNENLIIQSSLKDISVMEVYRDDYGLFTSYDFVSPIGEGIYFKENQFDKLKSQYKKIIYFGNNDYNKVNNPGLGYCKKWNELFNIPFTYLPDILKSSDISDCRRDNGHNVTFKVLEDLEQKINNI